MTPEDLFLFSSLQPLPDTFFRGYGFFGTDFVSGRGGFESFPGELTFGEDGRYFLLRKDGDAYVCGTDYKGFMKLFLYRSEGGRWAISNSFAKLMEHAKSAGWSLTPQKEHLVAWSIRDAAIWQQLWSFDTAVEEITLVPSRSSLEIRNNLLSVTDNAFGALAYSDYEAALTEFLSIWSGRIATLANSPVSVDITGGVDSRTVLSMFLPVLRSLGGPHNVHFRCGYLGHHQEDFAIAQQIASAYSFSLNTKPAIPSSSLSGRDQYEMWKHSSLGSYSPVYFPEPLRFPDAINVGGGGGEGHRSFYGNIDVQDYLGRYRDRFSTECFVRIKTSAQSSMARLNADVQEMVSHYREFRDRIHSGLLGNFGMRLSPLASKYLYAATDLKSEHEISQNQVLFDIMNNSTPELMSMPYDKQQKSPSNECLSRLTSISKKDYQTGIVYYQSSPPQSSKGGGSGLDYLTNAARKAGAANLVDELQGAGKLPRSIAAAPLHLAILRDAIGAPSE